MEIAIFNRDQIEVLSQGGFAPHTALISITDAGWQYAVLEDKPEFLFQVAFDDVDNDVFVDELGRAPTEEERCKIEAKYYMLLLLRALLLLPAVLQRSAVLTSGALRPPFCRGYTAPARCISIISNNAQQCTDTYPGQCPLLLSQCGNPLPCPFLFPVSG